MDYSDSDKTIHNAYFNLLEKALLGLEKCPLGVKKKHVEILRLARKRFDEGDETCLQYTIPVLMKVFQFSEDKNTGGVLVVGQLLSKALFRKVGLE